MYVCGYTISMQIHYDVIDLTTEQTTDIKEFMAEKSIMLSFVSHRKVLILTSRSDYEADLVCISLINRSIDYIRLNKEDIPQDFRVNYQIDYNNKRKITFTIKDELIDTTKIGVVWLRLFSNRDVNYESNYQDSLSLEFSNQQWSDAIDVLWKHLRENSPWINDFDKGNDKLEQLELAGQIGFKFPKTLITNDPIAARDFYQSHGGQIIIKALHHHGTESSGKFYSMFTHIVTESDLENFDDLIFAPCILQEIKQKNSELRVTVIGDRVLAVKMVIKNQQKLFETIQRVNADELSIEVIDLNDTVKKQCIDIIDRLGLQYGAIDLIEDINGTITFLEVNPRGDWYGIERITKLPYTESIADLLEQSMTYAKRTC